MRREAVLLMAHGAPAEPNDIEEFILRIRHGRPLEPEQVAVIRERYRLVGGSPLLKHTQNQAAALQQRLAEEDLPRKVYIGMRHWQPLIQEAVDSMIRDDVESILALCLAPQFSRATTGSYEKSLMEALGEKRIPYKLVRSYARHPQLIRAFTEKLKKALSTQPDSFVIFTAHSLPERILQEGDGYDYEAKETACLVARAAGLTDWRFAYQSQGMTEERWLGPTVESVFDWLQSKNISRALVCPIGFVSDHVEILYDIDIHFRHYAASRGIQIARPESLNDSPAFIDLLLSLIREQS